MLGIIAAFAAVYVIWGSTYLGIKIAIETLPPLLMAGTRFALAGILVIAWMRARHDVARPTIRQWRNATIVGGLLLFTGNGLIVIAQQRLPSGLAALLVATVPLWMALMDWLAFGNRRPKLGVFGGLALGLAGVLVLMDPRSMLGEPIHLTSALLVLIACMSWSVGSLFSRRADLPKSLMQASGMEMLCGGLLLIIAGSVRGEWLTIDLASASWRSTSAFVYLVIFGSLVGFSAYIWLLKHVSAAAVSTYAYVNPMVAVALGWAFAGEPIGLRMLLASALIIAAVVMITLRRQVSATPMVARTLAPRASADARRLAPAPAREPALCGCAEADDASI